MNEYIIIYQTPAFNKDRKSIDEFFRSNKFEIRRLNEAWPHIVHIDSKLSTEEFASALRAQPFNSGAILFSINQTVHV